MEGLAIDAVTLRGLERLIVVFGAIFFAYLGYRLFLAGIDQGPGKVEAQTRFYKFAFSGVGPGLFFMVFGAIILITALFTGGAKSKIDSGLADEHSSNQRKIRPSTAEEEPQNRKNRFDRALN